MGGSSIALFARVGGGIFTKAADIGADLSGKNEYGMAEDDPRNPACIADNVGDNVGDVAGMGADLFGSLAESTCASLVIAGASITPVATAAGASVPGLAFSWPGLMFPAIVSSSGIISGIGTLVLVRLLFPVRASEDVGRALKAVLLISTALQTPLTILVAYLFLPPVFALEVRGDPILVHWWQAMLCVLMGLWSGLIIGAVAEYYTSHTYRPVREVALTQCLSASTGIIYGLSLGYLSTVVPIVCLSLCVCISHSLCGIYGVSLAAVGMLSTLTIGLTIDAYGPISDNAGGIAEMARLGPEVRRRTDALDTAGNITAAVGKVSSAGKGRGGERGRERAIVEGKQERGRKWHATLVWNLALLYASFPLFCISHCFLRATLSARPHWFP